MANILRVSLMVYEFIEEKRGNMSVASFCETLIPKSFVSIKKIKIGEKKLGEINNKDGKIN
jgi:hypothetical protein